MQWITGFKLICALLVSGVPGDSLPKPAGLWMYDRKDFATDLSGNGNHGEYVDPSYITGPRSLQSVFRFQGNSDRSDRVDIVQQNTALQFTGDSTYMIYLFLENGDDGPLFNLHGSDWGVVYWICCSGNGQFHYRFDVPNSVAVAVSAVTQPLPLNEWVHIACVRNQADGTVKFYVNGEEEVSSRSTGFTGPLDSQHDNIISTGALHTNTFPSDQRVFFGGAYCQAYFNAALTTAQIRGWKQFCLGQGDFALYPWPRPIAVYPLNQYYETENAAFGLLTNGVLHSEVYTNVGPDGVKGESTYFGSNPDSSYVSISNANGELAQRSWTYMTYIKMYSQVIAPLFEYTASDGSYEWHIWINYPAPTQIYMNDKSHSSYSSPVGSLKENVWQHLAISYDYSTGRTIMVVDDEIVDERSLGNIQFTQTDLLHIGKRENSANHRLDADLSCVQIFDIPLDVSAIRRARGRCRLYNRDHRPTPILVLPLNEEYGLREMGPLGRTADYTGDSLQYANGYRNLKTDHIYFDNDAVITPPEVVKNDWTDWTISIVISVWNNSRVELLDGKIIVDLYGDDYLTYKFGVGPEESDLLTRSDPVVVSNLWLVFSHDSATRMLTYFRSGALKKVSYVENGVLSPGSQEMNLTGSAEFGCYQVYDTHLTLSEIYMLKNTCYKKKVGSKVLPYPNGIYPLSGETTRTGITTQSGSLVTFGDIWYNATGPHGGQNSAASFHPDRSCLLYTHKNFYDSMTISVWIRQEFVPFNRTVIIGSYPTKDSAITGRGTDVGMSIELVPGGAAGTLKFYTTEHSPRLSGLINPILEYQVPVAVGEWYHVAATYDLARKRSSLYFNGELVDSKQVHRHRIFGDYPWNIGNLYFDSGYGLGPYNGTEWAFHGDMSCLQLYSESLTAEQIKFSQTLCHPSKYSHYYEKHPSMAEGWSRKYSAVDRKVKAKSQSECFYICSQDDKCQSVAYGNGDCDIEFSKYGTVINYEYTGKNYYEKVKKFADLSAFY